MAERAWCDPLGQPGCARVALDDLVDPLAGEPVPVLVYEQARLLARSQEQRAAVLPEFRSWWARGWALRGRKPLWGLGFEGL